MKKIIIILSVIGGTITIFLSASMVFCTKAEVQSKVFGLASRLDIIYDLTKENRKDLKEIKEHLMGR